MFRNVFNFVLGNEEKYVETADRLVQVVEPFFSDRMKYGRGDLQSGDTSKKSSEEHEFGGGVGVTIRDWTKFNEDADSWACVLEKSEPTQKERFIRVQERDQFTLKAVLEKYFQPGFFVWTDRWKGYSNLAIDSFRHVTVNHREKFVYTETGVSTQRIERALRDIKAW